MEEGLSFISIVVLHRHSGFGIGIVTCERAAAYVIEAEFLGIGLLCDFGDYTVAALLVRHSASRSFCRAVWDEVSLCAAIPPRST